MPALPEEIDGAAVGRAVDADMGDRREPVAHLAIALTQIDRRRAATIQARKEVVWHPAALALGLTLRFSLPLVSASRATLGTNPSCATKALSSAANSGRPLSSP